MRILAILVVAACVGCAHQQEAVTETKVVIAPRDYKAAVVAASIYGYEINTNRPCPCPYSGATCRGKSAWDKPNGANPKCYKSEVTEADVKRLRDLEKTAPERR